MVEKITDQNLERYNSRLKEWCDRKFFKKSSYGKYQITEKASIVSFYSAPDTLLEGKVNFLFKETMPVGGVKGLNNPSTITGVSNVKLLHCSKNILNTYGHLETNGIIFTDNGDGSITVNGTCGPSDAYYHLATSNNGYVWRKQGYTYTLSGCPSGGSNSTFYIAAFNSNGLTDYGSSATRTMLSTGNSGVAIVVKSGTTVSNLVFWPQLEIASTATSFEKYDGTDYTISLDNTYYGSSIDFITGIMTVTYAETTLTGNEDWVLSSDSTDSMSMFLANSVLSYTPYPDSGDVCTHIPLYSGPNVLNSFRVFTNKTVILRLSATDFPTVDVLKTWLQTQNNASTPVKIIYMLATPFTVQLSPVQISALAQINKYTPRLNIVYTNVDSVQISYLKSPIRDEYEKTQAILSLGGNN